MKERSLMLRASDIDLVAELERILADLAPDLTAKGVRAVSLVGSRARGTARPDSDIDLLVDLAPDATFGLIDLVQLKDTLGDALGRKVDIAFKGGLRTYVEAHMTRDARQVL
jgi:predicted nucleotidyltransferase